MLRLVLASAFVAVVLAQRNTSEKCEFIVHLDCSTFGLQDICATNNKTYMNHCAMSKAFCQDHSIHQVHEGACGTDAQANHVNGHEVSFRYYCYAIKYSDCGDDHEILCGTDGVTYSNICSFEKAKCDNITLDVAKIGPCK